MPFHAAAQVASRTVLTHLPDMWFLHQTKSAVDVGDLCMQLVLHSRHMAWKHGGWPSQVMGAGGSGDSFATGLLRHSGSGDGPLEQVSRICSPISQSMQQQDCGADAIPSQHWPPDLADVERL